MIINKILRISFLLVVIGIAVLACVSTEKKEPEKKPEIETAEIKEPAEPHKLSAPVPWETILYKQTDWYKSADAMLIGDNILLYQRNTGGWEKNVDMAKNLTDRDRSSIKRKKKSPADSTIDNEATSTQILYLSKVYVATKEERFKEGILKGLDYLLAAQYDNGGWPQYYPNPTDYHRYITYNDNAMINVMNLLKKAVDENDPDFAFIDHKYRKSASEAVKKGIDCILKTQIVVDGILTAWCAQHDEKTLQPAPGRPYEKESISGSESISIIQFLMEIENPGPEIVNAIQSAVAYFNKVRISGIEVVEVQNKDLPGGFDTVVVENPDARLIWARFYEIETDRPIFCGRDGIIKYSLAEIEAERRNNYRWYVYTPENLLAMEYPEWQAKWAPDNNVLE